MEKVDKAVVLAAGEGTRLEPITNAVPKEMIRVGRKPTIHHIVNLLKEGGISDILVVVGRKKQAIMDYLGSGKRWGLDIYYRIQEEPKGTADAVSLAEEFVGSDPDEDFVVIYGDNYLTPYSTMEDIVDFHIGRKGIGTLVLNKVEDPTRFGIVNLGEDKTIEGMVEKPTLEEAHPYRYNKNEWLNIAGLMILNRRIFDYINKISPGKQGELWLTDAIERMRKKEDGSLYGYVFEGRRYDIGTFDSLAEADRLELQRNDE